MSKADRITATWLKIKGAGEYSNMSARTVRGWTKNGLRHVVLPSGVVLIKVEWLDEFLEGFAVDGNEVDAVVDGVLKDLDIT